MENVLCADWNSGDIADIEVVLEADQIGQVCTGKEEYKEYRGCKAFEHD